jgi:hypothetical protein
MFTHKKILAAVLFAASFVGCVVEGGDDDDGGAETSTATATQTATQTVTDTDGTATATVTETVTDTDGTATATVTDTDATATETVTDTDTDGVDTGVSTTEGETETGGGGMFCQATCTEAADCCQPGTEDMCPGDPPFFNWECTAGLCELGGCTEDADCAAFAGTSCLMVNGVPTCAPVCETDDECLTMFDETCTGMSDSGEMICVLPDPEPCMTNEACFGFGTCDVATGVCSCADATECPKGYDCVGG